MEGISKEGTSADESDMDDKTARRYVATPKLPSEMKPRTFDFSGAQRSNPVRANEQSSRPWWLWGAETRRAGQQRSLRSIRWLLARVLGDLQRGHSQGLGEYQYPEVHGLMWTPK